MLKSANLLHKWGLGDSDMNSTVTWNEFCKNISYQLNRDFTIVLQKYNDTMFITTDLKLGFNYLESHKIEVREIFTQFNG